MLPQSCLLALGWLAMMTFHAAEAQVQFCQNQQSPASAGGPSPAFYSRIEEAARTVTNQLSSDKYDRTPSEIANSFLAYFNSRLGSTAFKLPPWYDEIQHMSADQINAQLKTCFHFFASVIQQREEAKTRQVEEAARRRAEAGAREEKRREYERIQKLAQEQHHRELIAAYETAKSRYPNDVIAQVLNYTTTGEEMGRENEFWRQKAPCIYERITSSENGLVSAPVLDFSTLNPDEIQFEIMLNTAVKHKNSVLVYGLGTRQIDRLTRGWRVIFDNCRGTRGPF